MNRRASSALRAMLVALLAIAPALPVSAGAVGPQVAPSTTIVVDPATPDGLSGWWIVEPDVSLESDQDGTVYYSYDGGASSSLTVTAGVPAFLTDVPQGETLLSAYAVNAGSETESPPVTRNLKIDSDPPTRPLNASWQLVAGNTIQVDWDASVDTASGVSLYAVYRNMTGPPFDPADLVGVTATPGFSDTSYPPVSGLRYAVEAWDVAGNTSVLSDLLVVDIDLTPPAAPNGLEAWFNAAGWVRVSWDASFDAGTGIAYYLVYRSVDGGALELVGTVPANVAFYDDHDSALSAATTVEYDVVAVDRAGNESDSAGQVATGRDLVPPVAPQFAVRPVWSGDRVANDSFLVDWSISPATDVGSGVLFYEVRYGSDPQTPTAQVLGGPTSGSVSFAEEPATLLYFWVRVQDRAGNVADSGVASGRNVPVYNLAGADRIATSLAVSAAAFDTASTVVFASAYNYPDALCAASLAGRVNGPVLLAGAGPLTGPIVDELGRLGAVNAYVIGGPAAVSDETLHSIEEAMSGTVTRIAGLDRYETAGRVAAHLGIAPAAQSRAFVVTGEKFPDALSVGAAAFAEVTPILFARASGIPAATTAAFTSLDIDSAVVVGGPAVVTTAAESALAPAERVYGATRYETARAFAQWAINDGVLSANEPCVATGLNFPDGLSAGPLAGVSESPVLLSRTQENVATVNWLVAYRARLSRAWTIGGPAALDADLTRAIWVGISVP